MRSRRCYIWLNRSVVLSLFAASLLLTACNGAPNSNVPVVSNVGTPAAGLNTSSVTQTVAVSGAARNKLTQLTATTMPGNAAYKIGPQDELEIAVFRVKEFSRKIQVADNGTINMPLIGEVQAAGKTTREVEQELTRRLGAKYLQNPQVSVSVKEYNSQRVTVEGAVVKPGVFPLRGHMTLMQTISTAGGLNKFASTEVMVFRQQAGGRRAGARFEIEKIRTGAVADPKIVAGDMVVVPNSTSKQAFEVFIRMIPLARYATLLL